MDGGESGFGGMFRSECNTLKVSEPLGTTLQIRWLVAVLVAFTLLLVMLVLL